MCIYIYIYMCIIYEGPGVERQAHGQAAGPRAPIIHCYRYYDQLLLLLFLLSYYTLLLLLI